MPNSTSIDAAAEVGDQVQRRDRRPVAIADRPQRAGLRQVVDVVAGRHRQRPVLAPAGDPGEDQPRVDRRALVGPDAESLAGAGPEAVEQHIGLRSQVQQRLRLVLDVEVDDALAAVHQVEVLARHRQAAGPAHPHHVGARGRPAPSPRAGRGRFRPVRLPSPRPGVRVRHRRNITSGPSYLQDPLAQARRSQVSMAPLIALSSRKPGSGTDGSTVMSNRTRVLSPSGVSVYFASCVRSCPALTSVQLDAVVGPGVIDDLLVGDPADLIFILTWRGRPSS